VLKDANGDALDLRHISLLWSTFFKAYLAFGERGGEGWAFSLSADLIHWSVPVAVDQPNASWWKMSGNASISLATPMPGRWIVTAGEAAHWVSPPGHHSNASAGVYKYKALCGSCPTSCQVCPGPMGDVCARAEHVSQSEFDAIPTATVDFSCSLVSDLSGYSSYIYPTLVDDSYHAATGTDPSLNVVGQSAHIFFVANPCAGTSAWKPGDGALKCTILDGLMRTRRNIVSSTIRFEQTAV
jgi:hypothetical protein